MNMSTLFLLFLLIHFSVSFYELFPKTPELTGVVDDCCCEVEIVEKYNDKYFEVLDELVRKKYFKLFKVNYLSECPFWVENYICQMGDSGESACTICECDSNEIPLPWKEEDQQLSRLGKIVENEGSIPENWKDNDESSWLHPDYCSSDLSYVDLIKNPERYTGYGGFNATRIWGAIYNENCFSGELCFEQRVFYRLISGLHASITAHIFENYFSGGKTQPNLSLFVKRLGAFPDRLKNIYFTFLFMLRAANKLSVFFRNNQYVTGNVTEDKDVQQKVNELLDCEFFVHCDTAFDETTMFVEAEKASLKKEFQRKFKNISEIMDCVSCESCKVHAKLMIVGIGTALKILLTTDSESDKPITIHRNEIIAFINTLHKLTESIKIVRTMRERESQQILTNRIIILISFISILILLVVGSKVFSSSKRRRDSKKSSKELNNNRNSKKKQN